MSGRGGDRTLLSLPSLSRAGHHGEDWGVEDKKRSPLTRLKWVDALNTWVPEKKVGFFVFCLFGGGGGGVR